MRDCDWNIGQRWVPREQPLPRPLEFLVRDELLLALGDSPSFESNEMWPYGIGSIAA